MRLMINVLGTALAVSCLALAACGSDSSADSLSSPNGAAMAASVLKAAVAGATISPSGTTIPSATRIIDGGGNVWTVSGGVIYKNGALAGYSANVALLLYDSNTLYHENSAGGWWSWSGSAWKSSSDPRKLSSPSGTTIPSATQITDSGGNVWAVSGGVVYKNGALAGYSANVARLLYDNNTLYHENSAGGWWSWSGSAWKSSSDPRKLSSPSGTTIPSATQITDSGGNVWAVSGGVVYKNGVLAGYSANVARLLYDNNTLYHENSAGGWWSWSGSAWKSSSDPIPLGSTGAGSATAPTISGSPSTSDIAGQSYSFVPTTNNPGGGKLSFSITGKPSWASFSTATGALTGAPSSVQVGVYSDIRISTSNGSASASLAAFSITVTTGSANLSWSAPTQTTNGKPLTDLAGYTIYYGTNSSELTQTIEVTNPSATSYDVSNLTAGTYYFAVAAYTAVGTQSARSSVVSKAIL